jgi:hypothetical protein
MVASVYMAALQSLLAVWTLEICAIGLLTNQNTELAFLTGFSGGGSSSGTYWSEASETFHTLVWNKIQ